MEFSTHTTLEGAGRLTLDGDMTIYQAAQIKQALLDGVQSRQVLELDLSQVGEMDTAGFQLLVMAKRESERLGHALRIVAHSPGVGDVLGFYNMDAYFGVQMVMLAERP
ncbi:MAG: STAS domain-containing protein [Rhodocyclaceae bacterium]|jgi:anti-anti-sigma factor|nr:STAS domain-containing protein [Rhodocyclaceae bacterium]